MLLTEERLRVFMCYQRLLSKAPASRCLFDLKTDGRKHFCATQTERVDTHTESRGGSERGEVIFVENTGPSCQTRAPGKVISGSLTERETGWRATRKGEKDDEEKGGGTEIAPIKISHQIK